MSDGKIQFYTNPRSRSRIIRWMLEELGEPYDCHLIEFGEMMKSEPYISINPMGKVPAIVHGKNTITECPAICTYLADAFPQANLAPALNERADYYRWLFFAAGPVEAAVTDRVLGVTIPEEKKGTVGYGNYDLVVENLSSALRDREFIAGNQFTAADVYVGSQVGWGIQFKTLPELSEFARYWERLSSRPAYKRACELDDVMME